MSIVFEPSQGGQGWLACKLDKGMCSDEMAVTYPAEGGLQKSVFVEKSAVEASPGERGRVGVRLVRQNGCVLAVLPSSNQDIVYVQPQDIAE
jgi:hypothetical protein